MSDFVGFDYFSAIIVAEIGKSKWMDGGQVYDYAASQFTAYPAVVVTPENLDSQFADTSRNSYLFSFNIMCFMDRQGREQEVEVVMRGLIDDIMQRLNNNTNINGTQNTFGKPITATWGYTSKPEPNMRVANLKLTIETGQDNSLGGGVVYNDNYKPILT